MKEQTVFNTREDCDCTAIMEVHGSSAESLQKALDLAASFLNREPSHWMVAPGRKWEAGEEKEVEQSTLIFGSQDQIQDWVKSSKRTLEEKPHKLPPFSDFQKVAERWLNQAPYLRGSAGFGGDGSVVKGWTVKVEQEFGIRVCPRRGYVPK